MTLSFGWFQGWVIVKSGIASFIVTLGGLFFLRGVTEVSYRAFNRAPDQTAGSTTVTELPDIKNIIKDVNYPILIDQEGGRVSRLNKIINSSFFSQDYFGKLYKKDKKVFRHLYKIYIDKICHIMKKIGIIGSGLLGCLTAYKIAKKFPSFQIFLIDGAKYKVEFEGVDRAGNKSNISIRETILYDITKPIITMSEPAEGTVIIGKEISYSISEDLDESTIVWNRVGGNIDENSPHNIELSDIEKQEGTYDLVILENLSLIHI